MASKNGISRLINGGTSALARNVLWLLFTLGAVVVSSTLLYAQIKNNIEDTSKNRTRVEAIERSMNEVTTQQRLLIQRFDTEKEANKEFRNKTSSTLDKILDRLPRRERPVR